MVRKKNKVEHSCRIRESIDKYGWSNGRDGCDGCNGRTSRDGYDQGRDSLDLRLLVYSQNVEYHSVHVYIDRYTITQDRLPNRKKGHIELEKCDLTN